MRTDALQLEFAVGFAKRPSVQVSANKRHSWQRPSASQAQPATRDGSSGDAIRSIPSYASSKTLPALTAFIAIPLLGEWPSDIGWVAILFISAGVYLTSGGPLPGSRPTGTLMIMTKPSSVAISTPAAHAQPPLSTGRVAGKGLGKV